MSIRSTLPRRFRSRGIFVTTAVTAMTASLLAPTMSASGAAGGPGAAAAAQDPQCAEAYPVKDLKLTTDLPVTGMTVSSGTTPDPFSGSVLGVLDDGIAPGIDMILVELTSTEIDRVGGIWAGMSGSPVYAEDGRLIGAVSYGLAFGPSPVAGVTPAEEMQALLDADPAVASVKTKDKVALPNRTADRIVSEGLATTSEVNSGLSRLPMSFGVSGMANAKRLQQFVKQLGMTDLRVYNTGSATVADPADEIVAGGNLAVTFAYGDLTAGGVGTATQVCGDEVLAFGHPAFWFGPTSLNLHGAKAIYVQEDPTLYPFKVANITAPVGTIGDDRWAGIHGYVGELPDTATITSDVDSSEGASRDNGTTQVSVPDFIPDVAAFHLLSNLDRVFDGIGKGSSRLRMTVEGTRADGSFFTVSRVDRYASEWDITFESIFESYSQLYRILNNRWEDVVITDVDFRAFVDRDWREHRIGTVDRLVGNRWVRVSRDSVLRVRPGSLLTLRVHLPSMAGDAEKSVEMKVRIPRGTDGRSGSLRLIGGNWMGSNAGGTSFDDMLTNLENAPHNNDVVRTLRISKRGPDLKSTAKATFSDVVSGVREISIRVRS